MEKSAFVCMAHLCDYYYTFIFHDICGHNLIGSISNEYMKISCITLFSNKCNTILYRRWLVCVWNGLGKVWNKRYFHIFVRFLDYWFRSTIQRAIATLIFCSCLEKKNNNPKIHLWLTTERKICSREGGSDKQRGQGRKTMFFVPRTVDMVVRIAFVVVAHKNSTIDRYTSKKEASNPEMSAQRILWTLNTQSIHMWRAFFSCVLFSLRK